jgi:hypothetical protein
MPTYLIRYLGYEGHYKVGSKLLSREPRLALVNQDGDPEWSTLVNLVVNILFTAEALNITQSNAKGNAGALEQVTGENLAAPRLQMSFLQSEIMENFMV